MSKTANNKPSTSFSDKHLEVLQSIEILSKNSNIGLARTKEIIKQIGENSATVRQRIYYLRLGGFIESPTFAHWRLTDKGKNILSKL